MYGNCDTFLYLGGNEQSTYKYVSELLGKETIDTNSYGKSTGNSGNYSTNYQIMGRELMTPEEVRLLDNKYAMLFIRGEKPIIDLKYDILNHPNVKYTTDGNGKPYIHGSTEQSTGTISWDFNVKDYKFDEITKVKSDYLLISEEEIDEYLKQNTEENENNK